MTFADLGIQPPGQDPRHYGSVPNDVASACAKLEQGLAHTDPGSVHVQLISHVSLFAHPKGSTFGTHGAMFECAIDGPNHFDWFRHGVGDRPLKPASLYFMEVDALTVPCVSLSGPSAQGEIDLILVLPPKGAALLFDAVDPLCSLLIEPRPRQEIKLAFLLLPAP